MNSTTARPLNVSYLVMGLVFLGIAGTWALHETGVVDGADVEWLVPLSLVVAGVLGLVAFATRGVRGRRTGDPAEHATDDTYAATYGGYDTYDSTPSYDTTDGETR
ncbi:MAG TPA: hypothetical protein VFV40_03515 [Nocardioides sp.]|nr:hypothetical protein [Nocardioides sp.]